jgi:hypothetical protein
MKKLTLESRLVAGLIVLGYTEDKSYRGNKRKFTHPTNAACMFVGNRGSLRVGRTVSDSHSVGDATYMTPPYVRVLTAGAAMHGTTK